MAVTSFRETAEVSSDTSWCEAGVGLPNFASRRTRSWTPNRWETHRVFTGPKNNWEDRYLEHADLRKLERSKEVFRKIEMDPCLSLSLPRPTATNAGASLEHAAQTFEKLYSKYQPMTFKFGITHDASVRWRNETFGYTHSKGDKFDHMLVVYAAANPYGPAFLEASMIQRFGSDLFAVFIFYFFQAAIAETLQICLCSLQSSCILACSRRPGIRGCKTFAWEERRWKMWAVPIWHMLYTSLIGVPACSKWEV